MFSQRQFCFIYFVLVALMLAVPADTRAQQKAEKEPVTISVVAANPSKEKTQKIPVKIDLPQEIKPADVLEKGELELQYDDQRSIYFLFSPEITLKPQETRVFNVMVRNVWVIPEAKIEELRSYTKLLVGRLEGSEYAEQGKKISEAIYPRLDGLLAAQKDESIGQKQRIGLYRQGLQIIEQVKEELAKMEKLLSFQGGTPVPQMLQEAKVKSDAPSTKTTWLIIMSIMVFIGLLGAQFFFTWHRRAESEKKQARAQKQNLPGATADDANSAGRKT